MAGLIYQNPRGANARRILNTALAGLMAVSGLTLATPTTAEGRTRYTRVVRGDAYPYRRVRTVRSARYVRPVRYARYSRSYRYHRPYRHSYYRPHRYYRPY